MQRIYKLKPRARVLCLNNLGISLGNRKITKEVGIWNLPAIETCPERTKMCEMKCYARKSERLHPACIPARHRNLQAAQEENFVARMIELICLSNVGWFRIHESGDFFSQEYLNKWVEIAKALPEVRFLAFTSSHSLRFSRVPENMSILFSVWPDTSVIPIGRKAYVEGASGFSCPHDCGPGECLFCWKGTGDVNFKLH